MLNHPISFWIAQYGYPAIFFLLTGGIVGLPVPDQFVLVMCGYLVLTKTLAIGPTLVTAVLGSVAGITLSYALGRKSGAYVSRLRFAGSSMEKARNYFERFGAWTLVFGYFVPGIRNLIGFTSGMARLKMRYFAPLAYLGAIVSSITCVAAGYFLGERASWMLASFGRAAIICAVFAAVFIVRRGMRSPSGDSSNV